MNYLYSCIIDPRQHLPMRVAVHRVVTVTEGLIHVEGNIVGIWAPETDIVFRKRVRRPKVKVLSRSVLDNRGYATDGVRTYYTTPDVVQAFINNSSRLRRANLVITA